MTIETSNGYLYSYNPIDSSIISGLTTEFQNRLIKFKPLEEISSLPEVCSFTIGVTEQCNFRCSYCCYSGKYNEHRKHSSRKLSIESIKTIIDFIVKHACRNEITVDFYGGESLLELDWIKAFVQAAKEVDNISWRFEVSTNGLLLTPDIVDWLVENHFKIFVSVDGIGHFHDNNRKDLKGRPTYSTIETNLSYIKEHHPDYWKNNVHIMMTICDISDLPEIAKGCASSNIFLDKAPYRISEVSTIYNDEAPKLDESSELKTYMGLVEWYKDHPNNAIMSTFFNIWLAEWINRPIGEIENEIEYPTCVPHNRKLYIDASGSIGICERISDKLRIGTLIHDIDFDKVNDIARSTASFIDSNCSKCEIARVCDICPDVLKVPEPIRETYCHNQKVLQKIKFRCFCELAESELI